MTPLLQIKNLNIRAKEKKSVKTLAFIDELSVYKGECVALIGESGSGKSCTAMSILKLVPPTITIDGIIQYGNENLTWLTEKQMGAIRGQQIAMVFQDPNTSLNPSMKVGDQITETIAMKTPGTKAELLKIAEELFELMEIPDPSLRLTQYPWQLSGGIKQRVVIAIALSLKPHLLIADEPTTALDATVQASIIDLLDKLKEKTDTSILFISHNLKQVGTLADRTYVMKEGRIVEAQDTKKLFTNPKSAATKQLLEASLL